MARKGLIVAARGAESLAFGLTPFVVGIYEAQLPHLDAEMAELFEQYYQEARGAFTRDIPALHRVIPVQQAIPFELAIFRTSAQPRL
ncbi:MAG: hypothetical protein M5R40_26100 [Anaerolineae bacterium]|nr:hypothetical protein [Anaerolineae bacterium]